jgi:3-oxoadipate enol-lactonase / 4-carboxymuconolactone decarboxylase
MFVRAGSLDVHVLLDGPRVGEPVVLLHSLGTNAHLWDPQAEDLARTCRVIRPDLRGHGLTGATPGDYDFALLAADLAATLDALDVGAAHIGGISIGGMIAQEFAARYPARAKSLMLVDTGMAIGTRATWDERLATVRAHGIGAIADAVMARWVTAPFLASPEAAGLRAMLMRTTVDGYAGCGAAIAAADLTATTTGLKVPTLVVAGREDTSTPVALSEALAAAIPGATLRIIEGAAHLPNLEKPAELTALLRAFLPR